MPVSLQDLAEGYVGTTFADAKSCPVCGGTSTAPHKARNIHPDRPFDFDFRVCDACGHGWIDPMPTQGFLSHLYAVGSRSVLGEWGPRDLSIPEAFCRDSELGRPPGRYFELGVGQGYLYRLFVERGWTCAGVDPGDWSSRFPNVVRDLTDVEGDFNADVMAALDVLEHVERPVEVLRSLRKLAAPAARLYCATPNRESLRARRHREAWRMVLPLGHVNYYSKRSMTLAMEQAGFRVTSARANDLYVRRFPRRPREAPPYLVDLLGRGDQWIVVAEAVPQA